MKITFLTEVEIRMLYANYSRETSPTTMQEVISSITYNGKQFVSELEKSNVQAVKLLKQIIHSK